MIKKQINEYKKEIEESIEIKLNIIENSRILTQISKLANDCVKAIKKGNKVIFAGNGGSFADAQHLSAEFTSRFKFERSSMASIALGTNSSAMSAIGNDYGFEFVFSRELEAIGEPDDIFIAISTSGNSQNIINAINYAIKQNIHTYCLTGKSGGAAANICECIRIPSIKTERVQECHIMIGHILCGSVEKSIFTKKRQLQST
jgi:D-sedoheptulose 7-phosphate isomerase